MAELMRRTGQIGNLCYRIDGARVWVLDFRRGRRQNMIPK